jgi:maltose O-acetyltransferase
MNLFLNEIYEWLQAFTSLIPGAIGKKVRPLFLKPFMYRVGKKLIIGRNCRIQQPGAVSFGNNLQINDNVFIAANQLHDAPIIIGNNVLIGPNVVLHSGNHCFNRTDIPIVAQGHIGKRIIIEDDVWIGACSIILAGVILKKGTVVAAGAVVTKSTQPYAVIAGVPGKMIRSRQEGV